METIVVELKDLPIIVELVGPAGERRYYQMVPAGRRFGACLQGLAPGLLAHLAKLLRR